MLTRTTVRVNLGALANVGVWMGVVLAPGVVRGAAWGHAGRHVWQ